MPLNKYIIITKVFNIVRASFVLVYVIVFAAMENFDSRAIIKFLHLKGNMFTKINALLTASD